MPAMAPAPHRNPPAVSPESCVVVVPVGEIWRPGAVDRICILLESVSLYHPNQLNRSEVWMTPYFGCHLPLASTRLSNRSQVPLSNCRRNRLVVSTHSTCRPNAQSPIVLRPLLNTAMLALQLGACGTDKQHVHGSLSQQHRMAT